MPSNRFSDEDIIKGLRRRDSRVLRHIYKNCFPVVAKLILSNSGTEEDAKDVFQETLIVVFRNIKEDRDFKFQKNHVVYIYSIARMVWIQQLRNTKRAAQNLKDNHSYIDFEEPKPFNDEDVKYSMYQKAFRQLPEDCQKIILMSNDGKSQKEIAETLGFKNENYIKKRKHYCKEFLIKKIKEDPEYKDFKSD